MKISFMGSSTAKSQTTVEENGPKKQSSIKLGVGMGLMAVATHSACDWLEIKALNKQYKNKEESKYLDGFIKIVSKNRMPKILSSGLLLGIGAFSIQQWINHCIDNKDKNQAEINSIIKSKY